MNLLFYSLSVVFILLDNGKSLSLCLFKIEDSRYKRIQDTTSNLQYVKWHCILFLNLHFTF